MYRVSPGTTLILLMAMGMVPLPTALAKPMVPVAVAAGFMEVRFQMLAKKMVLTSLWAETLTALLVRVQSDLGAKALVL